jgi:AraC-like DNA-binding protein
VRVADGAPLTAVCVAAGTAWLTPADGPPQALRAGDLALLRGPDPYTVADDPATAPQATVVPGGCAVAADGTDLCDALDRGVRTWGTGDPAADGGAALLIGTYRLGGEVGGRLPRALPPLAVLRAGEWEEPLLPLLAAAITREAPGQEAVLDRLLDLLVTEALRAWFARPGSPAEPWYRAQADPVVGPVLRLLHDHPAHPWTVAGLAARAGVSRAALARRFAALVGQPPMAYLTGYRLDRAAELLREPDATLDAVARRVGYGSGFALSAAFKRERGVSPATFRAAVPPTENRLRH